MRKIAIRVALVSTILILGLWLTRGIWLAQMRDALFEYALVNLPEEQREELYDRIAAHTGTLWDTVPEPEVGYVGRRRAVVEHAGVEVKTNTAGMRSRRPYRGKASGVFRIVCLGDSFAMGMGGLEEDRFADQMEAFYRKHDTRVEGKEVEVLAVGLAGWTAVQQATYLTSRLSSYDPDVIVVLTVSNDITTGMAVTGLGTFTTLYSPEERHLGSGVFGSQAAVRFGTTEYTALREGLSPASVRMWDRSLGALDRLVRLQEGRGGKILLAVLDYSEGSGPDAKASRFALLYDYHLRRFGITAPRIVTSYFPEAGNQLSHDPHPNRNGHSILAHHFLHALDDLGWVENADGTLPALHPDLSLELPAPVTPERLAELHREIADVWLRPRIDFANVTTTEARAFLGGVLVHVGGSEAEAGSKAPWGSVRTGFLLRRGGGGAGMVTVDIEVPPFPELFPLRLFASIDGVETEVLSLATREEAGRHTLRVPLPESPANSLAVEVVLTTTSYFTTVVDPRMKSYRLLAAGLE